MKTKHIFFILFIFLIMIITAPALAQTNGSSNSTTTTQRLYGFDEDWLKSTVVVVYQSQYGTGWWVNPSYIVTAAHVVNYQSNVAVTIVRGSIRLSGTVVAADQQRDVAVIQVANSDKIAKHVLRLARQLPDYGETIYTIGYPSELLQIMGSVEKMSENPRVLSSALTWRDPYSHIFEIGGITDAGNSGGPVLDSSGNVIGLVSFALEGKAGTLYFASDVENIKAVLSQAGVSYELGSSGLLPDMNSNPALAGAVAGAVTNVVTDTIIILVGVGLGAAVVSRKKRR